MIDITNISVEFRGLGHVLDGLSLHVSEGEYIAILGPNGSGKSTLLKTLCGFVPVKSGRITMLGTDVIPGRFGDDFFGRVGVILQEPHGQFLSRDVKTEIISVLQNLGLSIEEQKKRFDKIIEQYELKSLLDTKPEDLSGGQMQLVNLAGVICCEPQVLLLDEPTTFLDSYFRKKLLSELGRLHQDGLTIMHITQYPNEAILAERAIILNGGRVVYDGDIDTAFNDELLLNKNRLTLPFHMSFKKVFGAVIEEEDRVISQLKLEGRSLNAKSAPDMNNMPILKGENLKFSYKNNTFELNIEKLELRSGEIVGLVGPGGCGKTSLAFLLSGLLVPQAGQVLFEDNPISSHSLHELRRRIGITWQLPDLALIGPSVRDDLEFGCKNLHIDIGEIPNALKQVGLHGFEDRIVDTLSGGEKRKMSLAGILLANPSYLILDEPEAFLDPVSQNELADVIRKLALAGRGILVIAHDLYFLSQVADRIIGMNDGKIVFDVPSHLFFSDSAFFMKLGLEANPMILFREKLLKSGIKISTASLNPAIIRECIG